MAIPVPVGCQCVPVAMCPGYEGAVGPGERVENKLPDLDARLISIFSTLPSSRQQSSDFLQLDALSFVGKFFRLPAKIRGAHIAQ